MATKTPQVGDAVSHDGCWAPAGNLDGVFEITEIKKRPVVSGESVSLVPFVVFENDRYRVEGCAAELVWLEEDGAWMLPGRLLSREQRELWRQLLGVRQGPPAEKHVEARAYLRMMADREQTNG